MSTGADDRPASPAPETQTTVGRWADETFPGGDPDSPRDFLRTLEEVVELCVAAGADRGDIIDVVIFAVNRSIPPMRAANPQPDKVAEEMADADINLDAAAHRRKIDRQAAKDAKMKINRARRWIPKGDGTGYHDGGGI